jgi:hypothetical protein
LIRSRSPEGLDEAIKALFDTVAASESVMKRTLFRVASMNRDVIRREYTPRSPTISDVKTATGGKATGPFQVSVSHRRVHPGGLERSIEFDATATDASIFVAANSEAGAYAFYIHNLKGVEWNHRGLGTISKGPKADDQFITRGIVDHEGQSFAIVEDMQKKAIGRAAA